MKNLLDKGESFSDGDTPIDCDLKGRLAQGRPRDRMGYAAEWRGRMRDRRNAASGLPRR